MFVSFLRIVFGESDSVAVGTGGICSFCGVPKAGELRSRRGEAVPGVALMLLVLVAVVVMEVLLLGVGRASRRLRSVAKGINALMRMSSTTATQTGLRSAG